MNLLRGAVPLLLFVALAGPARAEDRSIEDATRLFYSAKTHYRLGEFEQALHDFQEAYRLQQDPALLFNIAQCYRELGRVADAVRTYRSYIVDAVDKRNRAAVEELIAELVNQKVAEQARATAEPAKPAEPTVEAKPPPVPQASPAPPAPKKKAAQRRNPVK